MKPGRSFLVAFSVAAVLFALAGASPASAGEGRLALSTAGLPRGERAVVLLRGEGLRQVLQIKGRLDVGVRPGSYTLEVRRVSMARTRKGVERGAIAYPARKKIPVLVRPGRTRKVVARYAGVVNRDVRPLPRKVLGFRGPSSNPSSLLLPAGAGRPRPGTIFVSGPTPDLPRGLISKVTGVDRQGGKVIVSLLAVPLSDAVPSLDFTGHLALTAQGGDRAATQGAVKFAASSAVAGQSSACRSPRLLKFKAHLDSVELRQASLGAWPPQMRLTLAIRSTESMGVAAAAVGINCDWTLAELGPYQGAIPVGPIVVPVYATIPVKAGIHVNGRLEAGAVNVASTTVATVAAGSEETRASLSQQGTNVWLSGSPSITGSAKLSASVGVQAGIGVAKGANVHLEAAFGPEFSWSSGRNCELRLNLGSLSAGVSVLGKNLNTPGFTPLRPLLWTGCQPPAGTGAGAGAGGDPTDTESGLIPVRNAIAVDGASFFSCALLADGGAACWGGGNSQGAFGNGGGSLHGPVRVSGITTARALGVGFGSSCAVLGNGSVRCWGWNPFGVIGNGTTDNAMTPAQVVGINDAVGVDGGEAHMCAVLSSGGVKCWGRNWKGELGLGTTSGPETCDQNPCSRIPVAVAGIDDAKAIAAGGNQSCALLADGRVKCWGTTALGPISAPAEVAGVDDAVAISAGYYQACALLSDGRVVCWGVGAAGGLGNGSKANSATAVEVSGISDAVQIATGDGHSCAVLAGGTVKCWGSNWDGELGVGTDAGPEDCGAWGPCSIAPMTVSGISNASAVGLGISHSCAVLRTGRVMCWGYQNGWIGPGGRPNAVVPAFVP